MTDTSKQDGSAKNERIIHPSYWKERSLDFFIIKLLPREGS